MASSMNRIIIPFAIALMLFSSCKEDSKTEKIHVETPAPKAKEEIKLVETPKFDQQRAYEYVKKQVAFGPRVPNTKAQRECAHWLETELKKAGWLTNTQFAKVKAFNGAELDCYNIMGQLNPQAEKRILLAAHWDSRPFADRDFKDKSKAIDGANDGASGVAVLLQIAHSIARDTALRNLGVDIVFFDAEDYGKPASAMVGDAENSWCLGSQYWAAHIPVEGYKAEFGILLDMVGAKNAVFPKETFSMRYAMKQTNFIWDVAQAMGHKKVFPNQLGNPITDDHVYLNTIAGIPTVDIIHYNNAVNDFFPHHHRHTDNIDIIEPETLGIVGNVVLQVIYQQAK